MKRVGIPQCFFLVVACLSVFGDMSRCLANLDMFAGECRVEETWTSMGEPAMSYEVKHANLFQDINSPEGYCTAIMYASKVRVGGMTMWGIVCSTWIWVARKSVGRHIHPMGNRSQPVQCYR